MALSPSYSSASVAVDKATSDLLIAPDWTMNMDICDAVNTNRWQAKDVLKAVKRRLQHKSSRVQLLSLTLLETMVKNCGERAHFLIVERNILGEMVKIVKKKADMQVRDKILVLLDSWQEAFGGPGGKHPQFYWAFDELRRSGVEFPPRESDSALIFNTPSSNPIPRHAQAGFGMPSNSPRRLDETMATEIESLSLSSLESMRNVMELLSDMLQAVNASDPAAVKDEVIVDLVERCRANQKKLMQMLTTTGDEELLSHGLELNDDLQGLLAKHDAIAAGSPLPGQLKSPSAHRSQPTTSASGPKPTEEIRDSVPSAKIISNPVHPATNLTSHVDEEEEEEEEDDFTQLARRHSKARVVPPQSTYAGTHDSLASDVEVSSASASTLNSCTDLVLPDLPTSVKTKEQEIIDLLSITLSTTSTCQHSPQTPEVSSQDMRQVPASSNVQERQSFPQTEYLGDQGNQGQAAYSSYVVPWAQPESPMQSHSQHHQPQPHVQSYSQYQQHNPQVQLQTQYPPPPWASSYSNQGPSYASPNMFYTPRPSTTTSYARMQEPKPSLQHHNSYPSTGSNGLTVQGDPRMASSPGNPTAGQKLFMPSSRLFEDLNVLGDADGKLKSASSASPGMSGNAGQSMVGGRK